MLSTLLIGIYICFNENIAIYFLYLYHVNFVTVY